MTRNTVRKPAILIVDDDPSIRTFIQRILARHGYASIEAADASQGLSAFALDDVEIWLAIVDMILPGNAGVRVDLLDEVTVVHVENVRERGCR